MAAWTPTPRTVFPRPTFGTALIGAQTGPGQDRLAGLAVALLMMAQGDGWDRNGMVFPVLRTRRLHELGLATPASMSQMGGVPDLAAVYLPELDQGDGIRTVYHQVACLDLRAWDGVAFMAEARDISPGGTPQEVRRAIVVSSTGSLAHARHQRHRPLPTVESCGHTLDEPMAWFLRATLGRPNTDHRSVQQFRAQLSGSPESNPVSTLGALIADLNGPGDDIAVTPALRAWLGETTR